MALLRTLCWALIFILRLYNTTPTLAGDVHLKSSDREIASIARILLCPNKFPLNI